MMLAAKVWRSYIPPIILAVSLLSIYLNTVAPGLTWANGGSDGGDLITASFTGGVAHPTGYPLYLLLARLFQFLPIGTLAFRTNLMSVMATVLGAVLVYMIVTNSLLPYKPIQSWPAGLTAGYAFGLAPLIWSQAVITEVYALQTCLITLLLYLYIQPVQASILSQKRLDNWRGLVLGLGMANHITTIFLVPVAMLVDFVNGQTVQHESSGLKQRWFGNFNEAAGASFCRQLVWFGVGLCVYMIIPLRALAHPPVNWGNSVTPERFWWLVSGGVYPSYYLQTGLPGIWDRLQIGAALLLQQFGMPGLVIGVTGLVMYTQSRLYVLTIWTAVISLAFAVLYGSVDFYVYLIPMYISFAIWIGLGVAGLAQRVSWRFSILGWSLGLLLVGYFAARSLTYIGQVDASQDQRAESFGREVLSLAPEKALIFAKGDQAVFSLWYFHYALGERPDVVVVASDLLHFDWYQESLQSNYPSLILPGSFPWPETITIANPLRGVCYIEYVERAEIECLEPLKAP